MKILDPTQLRALDKYTIENEPIASIDLMERAAGSCSEWLNDHFDPPHSFVIIAGPGNNGGDGLVIARLLHEIGRQVTVFGGQTSGSNDYMTNIQRLEAISSTPLPLDDFLQADVPHDTVIIDAMFGYGLWRPLEAPWTDYVERVNALPNLIVSVDIPSGLFMHAPGSGLSVNADFTLTFQTPKLAFFIPENQDRTGTWIVLDIGLDKNKIDSIQTKWQVLTDSQIRQMLITRGKFDHKGTYGHALLVVGSFGKVGAAILAAKAALRSGVGLLTVHVPRQATQILQIAVPEAMVSSDRHDYNFSGIDGAPASTAIGLGCGLGQHGCTTAGIRDLLKVSDKPMVVDADGLNALASNPELIEMLPQNSILTPHLKEFARLFGESKDHYDRLEKLREAAKRYRLVIVLKGAHTAIATPDGDIYFNTTGNPGMATAGSGDVLTGIITGLLAQGISSAHAAKAGVYLHGLSGDIAAEHRGNEALLASDIIEHIGDAFKHIKGA